MKPTNSKIGMNSNPNGQTSPEVPTGRDWVDESVRSIPSSENDSVSDSLESLERQREVEFQKWAESSRLKTEDAMRLLECEIVFDHHLEGTFHEKQRVQGMLSLWKSLGYPTIQSLRELVEFACEIDVMFSANDERSHGTK